MAAGVPREDAEAQVSRQMAVRPATARVRRLQAEIILVGQEVRETGHWDVLV